MFKNRLLCAHLCIFIWILTPALLFSQEKTHDVASPDNKIMITAGVKSGRPYYSVSKDEQMIIDKSYLGFIFRDGPFNSDFELKEIKRNTFDETWKPTWGEESAIRNNYNELILTVEEKLGLKRQLIIHFRAFNDGVAFRYEFPQQKNLSDFVIMDEETEFNFSQAYDAWSIPFPTEFYEALYTRKNITQIDTAVTPVTFQKEGLPYVSIHEANLTDYASLNLKNTGHSTNLKSCLTPLSSGEKVLMKSPHLTPWRTIIITDKASDLLLSRMVLNLNEPSKIKDVSWIKPGRYIGIWWGMHMKKYTWEIGPKHGATTENVKRYIDFAAQHHFAGVLVEGWNHGWEDWKSYDFLTPYPDFDIKKITDYAASKNVKLIGHHETGGNTIKYERQMDSAFIFYKKYGVDAVKTGYVSSFLDGKERNGSQYGIRHYRKVIETAARHHIMIDNHEPAMPTGLQRTYPNLMTQEGVRGQEWDAWSADGGNPAGHTTIIPFTRGLAGPMDFTPATFNFTNTAMPDTKVHTTLAKQLALFVVLYSPLQMASDMIENYEGRPEFEFITQCPTNWSRTIIPHAEIGEYLTIVRKDIDSDNWFLGSITNESPRDLKLHCDFLDKGTTYIAHIYKDGPGAHYLTNQYPVTIEEKEVSSSDVLELKLAPGGGMGIFFEKKR